MKKFRYLIEYWATLGVALCTRGFSLRGALLLGDLLGDFAFYGVRMRRRVTLDNLTAAFPKKSPQELRAIARRAYRNFAKMMIEYIRFPELSTQTIRDRVKIENEHYLRLAMEGTKGAVCVGGHFGNWELMGAAVRAAGYPMCFLVGEQHNKLVDNLMNRYRELVGIEIIHMGMAVRGVLRALRQNKLVAMLSDQDAGREGVFVQFFNRPASTHRGPATFALKVGSPILFGSAIRLQGGKHRVIFEEVNYDSAAGLTPENTERVTQAYSAILEKYVRLYPDHWFWMHRRWKSKPATP